MAAFSSLKAGAQNPINESSPIQCPLESDGVPHGVVFALCFMGLEDIFRMGEPQKDNTVILQQKSPPHFLGICAPKGLSLAASIRCRHNQKGQKCHLYSRGSKILKVRPHTTIGVNP